VNFAKRTEGQVQNIIELKEITKSYFIGHPNEFRALSDVNIHIREGEFVSIIGESGSGKSTLMNIIGALDRPTGGQYFLDGLDVGQEKDHELSRVRNKKIGFVFQTFNLIPRMNALRNVELPMTYARTPHGRRIERAKALLGIVGMEGRMTHQPNELSGGQKQRVAIARAMANDPAIILADEPTGALDTKTGHLVMDIFHKLHEEEGKTIVLITHSGELAGETQRIITLRDGEVIDERAGRGKGGRIA
jgi:putative ABC transport system ATP-binding protein